MTDPWNMTKAGRKVQRGHKLIWQKTEKAWRVQPRADERPRDPDRRKTKANYEQT